MISLILFVLGVFVCFGAVVVGGILYECTSAPDRVRRKIMLGGYIFGVVCLLSSALIDYFFHL